MKSKIRDRRLEQVRIAFANNVRTLRMRKNWRQCDLADKLGVHRITIVRIETGLSQPLYSEACLMADALGSSISKMRGDLGATPR